MKLYAQAYQKFIRQSPRKLRLVADMVRGMPVETALAQLSVSSKRAAEVLAKTIRQAQANAVQKFNVPAHELIVDALEIEEGPTYKRWRPVSRGRAHTILKRTSHIKVRVAGTAA